MLCDYRAHALILLSLSLVCDHRTEGFSLDLKKKSIIELPPDVIRPLRKPITNAHTLSFQASN